jgi:hypothetical protein
VVRSSGRLGEECRRRLHHLRDGAMEDCRLSELGEDDVGQGRRRSLHPASELLARIAGQEDRVAGENHACRVDDANADDRGEGPGLDDVIQEPDGGRRVGAAEGLNYRRLRQRQAEQCSRFTDAGGRPAPFVVSAFPARAGLQALRKETDFACGTGCPVQDVSLGDDRGLDSLSNMDQHQVLHTIARAVHPLPQGDEVDVIFHRGA